MQIVLWISLIRSRLQPTGESRKCACASLVTVPTHWRCAVLLQVLITDPYRDELLAFPRKSGIHPKRNPQPILREEEYGRTIVSLLQHHL